MICCDQRRKLLHQWMLSLQKLLSIGRNSILVRSPMTMVMIVVVIVVTWKRQRVN